MDHEPGPSTWIVNVDPFLGGGRHTEISLPFEDRPLPAKGLAKTGIQTGGSRRVGASLHQLPHRFEDTQLVHVEAILKLSPIAMVCGYQCVYPACGGGWFARSGGKYLGHAATEAAAARMVKEHTGSMPKKKGKKKGTKREP